MIKDNDMNYVNNNFNSKDRLLDALLNLGSALSSINEAMDELTAIDCLDEGYDEIFKAHELLCKACNILIEKRTKMN